MVVSGCNCVVSDKRSFKLTHLDGCFHDQLRSVVECFGSGVDHSFVSSFLGLIYVFIDFLLVPRELWMDELLVENRRALRHWTQQPKHDAHFDLVVEREPREENIAECLERDEARKHHPVHHPSHVFFDVFRADRFVGTVSRVECPENETEIQSN
jgi:hypothetical protein